MNSKSILKEGAQLAGGTCLGWAVVVPLLGFTDFKIGVLSGILSAAVILAFYYFRALRNTNRDASQKSNRTV